MLILAVDTATTVASVALVEGERLVAEEVLNIPQKTHSERLLPVLVRILAGTGVEIEQVDGIAVSAVPVPLPACGSDWGRAKAWPRL
jgi:tRNA threonylcarbamoyladenosine biosynthesis protein TsaB